MRPFSFKEVAAPEPAELVQWQVIDGDVTDWIGTDVEFRILCDQDKTFLHFRQSSRIEEAKSFPQCSTGWAIFLPSLKEFA